jgi:drug/metabolite transporter (DMT)-like permease
MSLIGRGGPAAQLAPAAAVALCGLAWGGFWYPLRRFEEAGVGGGWVSFIFFTVSALSTLPFVLRRDIWRQGAPGLVLTGLLLGTAFSLYTVSLVMTDVVRAILLFYLTPVWSTLAGLAFFGARVTVSRALSIALGFGGMISILGAGSGIPLPRNAGDWIALVSGMSWAAGTLRSHARPAKAVVLPVLSFSVGGMVSSGAILIAAAAWYPALTAAGNVVAVTPWIVLLAFVIFVPPNFLVLWASQRIDSGRVGILLMTEVVAGAITAALFSGEPFGAPEAIGTALIVSAGVVEVLGRR